jgi:hypothetical protein
MPLMATSAKTASSLRMLSMADVSGPVYRVTKQQASPR